MLIFCRNMLEYLYNKVEHFITGAHILIWQIFKKLVFNNVVYIKFMGCKNTQNKKCVKLIFSLT